MGMIKNSQHERSSIATWSGVEFFPLAPRAQDIYLCDVAHHLANTCRYNGACDKFYGVAQHSVCVAGWLRSLPDGMYDDEEQRMSMVRWGLFHDAAEAYVSDVCAPIKPLIEGYCEVEDRLMGAVAERFELDPPTMPALVKYADKGVFKSELDSGIIRRPSWWRLHPEHPDAGIHIDPVLPEVAEGMFLAMAEAALTPKLFSTTCSPDGR